jgi:hypothetical protein
MPLVLLIVSVIAINLSPDLRKIGAAYFEPLKESQVWINLEPQNLESGPNPLRLNITVSFAGRNLASRPSTVDVRVQDDCAVFPLRVRTPRFVLIHDGLELRAGSGGLPVLFSSACGDDSQGNVMTTRIAFATFRQISAARNVEIHAFGFQARLMDLDRQALAAFTAAVADGVTLK